MAESINVLKKDQSSGRNYGIDLLRIVSMVMIVTLHVLRQGGMLDAAQPGNLSYLAVWTAEALCIGAVNLYALISGFVGVNSKGTRFYKLASMWLQVELYCIISTVIIYCLQPEKLDPAMIVDRLFPVSTNRYWYFTAYFIMFFFTPIYNKLLNTLNQKQLKYLCCIIFIFASLWPTIWQIDLMELNRGYSFLWLSLLYILGGSANKLRLHEKVNSWFMAAAYILLSLLGTAFRIASEELDFAVGDGNLLISYYSANIVAGTFCLFLAGANSKIKAKVPVKIIKTLSPLTFGVYIIHTSEYVWNYMIADAFADYMQLRARAMVLAVVATVLLIYLICSAIDGIRLGLFKLLRIDKLTHTAEIRIRAALERRLHKKERRV